MMEALPKLLPPYGELPPTFWEQHGTAVMVAGLIALLLVAAALWSWLHPKPPVMPPPEAQARQALESLLQKPEDGTLLSEISRILRRYLVAAFELPVGELTTSEFCRTLSSHDRVGAELAAAAQAFLRQSDERKFSPLTPSAPLGAAARALELIAQGEARRALLRQSKPAQPQPGISPSPAAHNAAGSSS